MTVTFPQSFSALKIFACARAHSENLRSRSHSRLIFARPCAPARAQNVLSGAQFCARFMIFNSWYATTKQRYFGSQQLSGAIFEQFLLDNLSFTKKCLDSGNLGVFYLYQDEENGFF